MSTPHADWDVYATFDEAYEEWRKITGWTKHILKNSDDTYSILTHINCAWCDYCEEGNAIYAAGHRGFCVHVAKDDAYELMDKKYEKEMAEKAQGYV